MSSSSVEELITELGNIRECIRQVCQGNHDLEEIINLATEMVHVGMEIEDELLMMVTRSKVKAITA